MKKYSLSLLVCLGMGPTALAQSQGLPNAGFIPGYGDLVSTNPIRVICYGYDGRCLEYSRGLVTRSLDNEARVFDVSKKVIAQFSYTGAAVTSGKENGKDVKKVDFTGTKIIP